ncbi:MULTISPECIES: translation initiation factor IF-3 [Kordiimonas]|uniref:translation initiation factor IF-3 n=1 Tax=Kordiimonas TaxID=288021 RepID=UPI002103AA00|nr:translation initiation factor IF-3 [Kordiimonas sp. SCSIO 12603]UTW60400.1 translation initiation factor IF-3 [Kordiimonas sp. SCSIO 12603]
MRKGNFAGPPKQSGPRVNRAITSKEVRLIGAEGENHGVVTTAKAMDIARDSGLDLVEISPNAEPPVCKVLDFGKFKYEQQKKANLARKKQKTQDVKEIKMRPGIDVHDYNVKLKKVHQFIENGDKVKLTIRFRGREMAHQDLGMDVLSRVADEMEEHAKIEARPKLEGRQMIMVIAPK